MRESSPFETPGNNDPCKMRVDYQNRRGDYVDSFIKN
jgi:hypothetical protein